METLPCSTQLDLHNYKVFCLRPRNQSMTFPTKVSILFKQFWDPCHARFFHHNQNLMDISACSHPNLNQGIATKFCTWHDSIAVVSCAKFCSYHATMDLITTKWNFYRIWIASEKSSMECASGSDKSIHTNYAYTIIGNQPFLLHTKGPG